MKAKTYPWATAEKQSADGSVECADIECTDKDLLTMTFKPGGLPVGRYFYWMEIADTGGERRLPEGR